MVYVSTDVPFYALCTLYIMHNAIEQENIVVWGFINQLIIIIKLLISSLLRELIVWWLRISLIVLNFNDFHNMYQIYNSDDISTLALRTMFLLILYMFDKRPAVRELQRVSINCLQAVLSWENIRYTITDN